MDFLATTRSRRSNAGANMSKLLDQEEEAMNAEDDFYKTHYGGFQEVENDSDFDNTDSSDSENVIDSDFDIDETQDLAAQDDEEATEKALQAEERESRQKRNVYKDPKARSAKQKVLTKRRSTPAAHPVQSASSSSSSTPTITRPPPRKKLAIVPKSTKSRFSDDALVFDGSSISRSLRKSTQKSSQEIRDLLDERKRKKKNMKKVKKNEYRQLTQEEMLREAKKTEVENTKSLQASKNLEIEKVKKVKPSKPAPEVPMIRYHSYTEYDNSEATENNTTPKKYSRTVITFPSEESLREYFPNYKPAEPESLDSIVVNSKTAESSSKHPNGAVYQQQEAAESSIEMLPKLKAQFCRSTADVVKYMDPLTKLPYDSQQTFRFIRNLYAEYLQAEFADQQDDPRLARFIEQEKAKHSMIKSTYIAQGNVSTGNQSMIKSAPIRVTIKPVDVAASTSAGLSLGRRPLNVAVLPASALPSGFAANLGSIGTTTSTNAPLSFNVLTSMPSGQGGMPKMYFHPGSTFRVQHKPIPSVQQNPS